MPEQPSANVALPIAECKYLTRGTVKEVYVHPNWPTAVLKIVRPELVDGEGQFSGHRGLKRRRNVGIYRQFSREISQYLSLCRRNYRNGTTLFPIAAPMGFVQTDQGLGLLSERIVDETGNLAPSIYTLLKDGTFSEVHGKALLQFFNDCARLHIVFGEVNWNGILFTTARSGKPEFVLVDGIGEKNILPLKSIFWGLNSKRVRKVQSLIEARIRNFAPAAKTCSA